MFNSPRTTRYGSARTQQMQTLQTHRAARALSKLISNTHSKAGPRPVSAQRAQPAFRASRQAAPCLSTTVQMVVRVATRDAELARRALHRMLGSALGVHTIDIDRRRDLACLHVELDRTRVGEAMSVLIRTVESAEFGTIRQLERA
ncbi:hypothetical protein [Paraburkholderia sp. J12]|uniref:hypothetical protein n=1 Tax=Paraburkholderia sp. J12 TaxID=2805432 RepID=UPI002ABDE19F|nr:hypothetical protein [Paraburkholderia sp. J12]